MHEDEQVGHTDKVGKASKLMSRHGGTCKAFFLLSTSMYIQSQRNDIFLKQIISLLHKSFNFKEYILIMVHLPVLLA